MTSGVEEQRGSWSRVDYPFTADGSGNATVVTIELTGALVNVQFAPGGVAPTGGWGATMKDAYSFDAFAGLGVGFGSATVAKRFSPMVTATDGTTATDNVMVLLGIHTLAISGCGAGGQGTISLLIKK